MIGLDFETYCDVDIKTHGLDRYINDPSFTVLCAAISHATGANETFDFVEDFDRARDGLSRRLRHGGRIAAHNAGFERAVCKKLGFTFIDAAFMDSAVLARMMGAGSKLEVAAPQLLDMQKVELGVELIRVFSVPTKANGGKPYSRMQILADVKLGQQWGDFLNYCATDAFLSRQIVKQYDQYFTTNERRFEAITQSMNDIGWFVDIDLVHEMQARYKQNLADLEVQFQIQYDENGELNFRSYKQLQKWCKERGVIAKSFDQTNLPKLVHRVETKLNDPNFRNLVLGGDPVAIKKHAGYVEVLAMLKVKEERGGSSLTKLQTIIDMVGPGTRLRNQYLHVGAGATFRTSGRGVQMQNLARLDAVIGDVEELHEPTIFWDNDKLAHNIRQVFKAQHPDGMLIVGDFKSVESRGLAYLSGEQWKLDAYAQNLDIYKQLATTYSSFGGVTYEDVTKEQRQAGKVGELACGYGAGSGAVAGFAEKMGIFMSEAEAGQIVADWRGANRKIVEFWRTLDSMLHQALRGNTALFNLPQGGRVGIEQIKTPDTLTMQHPGAQSLMLWVSDRGGNVRFRRVFHGCYYRGKDVCYYKPSELKNGELWRARMTTPPHQWYKLYGGKLAGILTQSFCRELFFMSLMQISDDIDEVANVKLIGQFHDEIVLEWTPQHAAMPTATQSNMWTLEHTKANLEAAMSNPAPWHQFPLAADVKHAHRYIK